MPLVTAAEIRAICPELPSNIDDSNPKLLKYISDAEIQDVRSLLGIEFYTFILANTAESEIVTLLDGGDYTYSGKTYPNPGLKEVIARFTFARFDFFGASTSTSFGSLVKQNQDARETTFQEKKDKYNTERQIAFEQWNLVKDFLCRNSSDYPLYGSSRRMVRRKYKTIRK